MFDFAKELLARGDLGHVALLAWATSVTGLLGATLKELSAAHRRFDDFVREIARLTQRFEE